MRALIIGGGIAGASAALALHAVGWEPEVHEARAPGAAIGQGVFLTLAVNGLRAFDALGAGPAVRDLGFETRRMRFASGTGKPLGVMPNGPVLDDGATVARTLRRADLHAALLSACRERGIAVHEGHRLAGVEADAGGVEATFAGGSRASADVLVAADGLRSAARPLLDPAAPAPRPSGLLNAGGFARLAEVPADGGDYRMIWGREAFFGYAVSPDGEAWWFANPPAAHPRLAGLVERGAASADAPDVAALAACFAADAGPAAALIAASSGPLLLESADELPPVPRWAHGRAVLVGDAAHAVSPATGQGASLAAEDAVALARHLAARPADPAAALANFEAERRPRVARVVAYGKRLGSTKAPGPVGRVVRDALLPLGLRLGASASAQARQAWLFDHRDALPAPAPHPEPR